MDVCATELVFFVNGKKVVEKCPNPEETLISYLRRNLRLTGTKESCGQGACGSCTVMVSKIDRSTNEISHYAVTACLVPVCSLHGLSVTTVEGVGSVNTKLHPVQEQLVQAHGTQCGFCTPGFVMSMYTLLRNNPKPDMEDVLRAVKGNLCRCTGYRPILDGFKRLTKDFCPMGDQCCQRTSSDGISTQADTETFVYDPSQEPIFPSELQLSNDLDNQSLSFNSVSVTWYRPTSLKELLLLKATYPGAKITAGNTTIGLERLHQNKHYSVLISASKVSELCQIVTTETGIVFGASVTLTTIEDYINKMLKEKKSKEDYEYRSLQAFRDVLDTFAALQIKNIVTIGGCVASCWSNSDIIPFLCAVQATIQVAANGQAAKTIAVEPKFFQSPGCTLLKDKELIVSVHVPFVQQGQYVYSIKQARRDFDTAIVSTSAVITVDKQNDIQEAKVYFGNILPAVYEASMLAHGLKGNQCEPSLAAQALSVLQEEFKSLPSLHQDPDMKTLMEAVIWKLVMKLVVDCSGKESLAADLLSAVEPLQMGYLKSTQVYEEVPKGQSPADSVGRPVVHRAAQQQATGEAQYIDDIPKYENELFLSLVTSPHSHANILSIDPTEALKIPGVVDVLTYKDIPGQNQYGLVPDVDDEEVFAEKKVTCVGQVVAGVLGTTQAAADTAVKLVHVEYESLPGIHTIQEAVEAKSFYADSPSLKLGDTDAGFKSSDVIVEGEVALGGQEHFYMETHRCLAVPLKEDKELAVYAPCQSQMQLQMDICKILGIPFNKVAIWTKRVGGMFGGKETRVMTMVTTAVAAFKHKQPVRCVLDRDTDMQLTGGRHPMLGKYKVGVSKAGLIQAVEVDYYSNGGNTLDGTNTILQVLLSTCEGCYRIPNMNMNSFACKTNLPSNTALRAFGRPQGTMIRETWVTHVAEVLGITPKQFKELNMLREGDPLPMNGIAQSLTIDRCWTQCVDSSNYEKRLKEIEEFNSKNKYRKKGITIGPMKYGHQFPFAFLDQAAALVNIYFDGSILVHHGGVEVGQGLHTKMIQVVSRALGQPISNIHVKGTASDIIPNASVTGGSTASDLNGGAILNACEKLLERLKPYKEANPDGLWVNWVHAAYFDRVSLSASGFYKSPIDNRGYNWKTGEGVMYVYYSAGAACSEVEVDIITGQHVVLRTDIVMDVGKSLNPAIDIGQIEGAFMMGYGLYCLEDLKFDSKGHLKTKNAMGYKIPVIGNLPREFNVSLLKDGSNPKAVYSSKAIGEPPLLLSHTVPLAIREAVKSYRESNGIEGHIQLNCPTTAEKIRRLCPTFNTM